MVNQVARARDIWHELRKTQKDAALLHSRFRQPDREKALEVLQSGNGVVVSTQAIEAGIDIDARLLLTDVAPYASLIQRFGRVNRRGTAEGEIFWVDRPLARKRAPWADLPELDDKQRQEVFAPYSPGEIDTAIAAIGPLTSAAPAGLPPVEAPAPWNHVLRRADLLDLFDTTPDLAGNELDISRFVRMANDSDVYVAWREWPDAGRGDPPLPVEIERDELCPVRLNEDLKKFARAHTPWVWDSLESEWTKAERWYPGMIVLFHVSAGGYTSEGGWDPASKARVVPVNRSDEDATQARAEDRWSIITYRQSLRDHTDDVCREMEGLLSELAQTGCAEFAEELRQAARLHDWGKAHSVMQKTLHNHDEPFEELLAKQRRQDAAPRHERRHFRHELASALAMLAAGSSDLAAYLAAAHHGRVRMSIRSMPGERNGDNPIARGIREGDVLPECDLGTGRLDAQTLSLERMVLGAGSWSDRMTALRDRLGPFRLAYLEMLLRSADEMASEKSQEKAQCA